MKRPLLLMLGLSLAAGPAAAQTQAASAPAADASVAAVRGMWEMMTNYVVASAEQAPDSLYAYRPTPEVRSFGQLIGHVAGAQYMFCAAALGEAPRGEDDIEKTRTTKTELVQALKESMEYCARAYAQADAATQAPIKLFGADRTRFFALVMNATHNSEHYGNLVTYMRINGMVPPSSQPRQ